MTTTTNGTADRLAHPVPAASPTVKKLAAPRKPKAKRRKPRAKPQAVTAAEPKEPDAPARAPGVLPADGIAFRTWEELQERVRATGNPAPSRTWNTQTNADLGALLAKLDDARQAITHFLARADDRELSALDALMYDELVHRLHFLTTLIEDQVDTLGSCRGLTLDEHNTRFADRRPWQ